jgi:hypothetical protein
MYLKMDPTLVPLALLAIQILSPEAEPHGRDKRQMPNVVFSIWRSGDFSLAQSGQTPNAKH